MEIKLNLGCTDRLLKDYINVDIVDLPGVDVVTDLSKAPWPWEPNTVSHVFAHDVIEHLPNKILTMNELWRVLEPGGQADILVPSTDGQAAFADPTHVSFWNSKSFQYFVKGTPYHTRFASIYGIQACFRLVKDQAHLDFGDGPMYRVLLEAAK
jgi:SAM-dependent methyltransferase